MAARNAEVFMARARSAIRAEQWAEIGGHGWPENGRGLRAFVDRAFHVAESGERLADRAPGGAPDDQTFSEARQEWIDRFERVYLAAALEREDGDIFRVARRSGLDSIELARLLRKHRIGR